MKDIFRQFLVLGLVSFGGPAAHVGYFHRRFVEELQWLDMQIHQALTEYQDLILQKLLDTQ